MYQGTAVMRDTPLARKIYARAQEIEKRRREAIQQEERAKEAVRKAEEAARLAEADALAFWDGYKIPCDNLPASPKSQVRQVVRLAAEHFGIEQHLIVGPVKPAEVIRARQIAMFVAYKWCKTSLPQIGLVFDRDHTTVLHAWRKIGALVEKDESVARDVEAIRAKLFSIHPHELHFWGS